MELQTKLKEAEDRVVRLHFPAMGNTVPIVDHEGQVLEPPGQTIDYHIFQRQGEISLLYSCLFATAAELDYLERAAHLYTQRKPSFSSTLKPCLITLCIGICFSIT